MNKHRRLWEQMHTVW